MVDLAHTPRAEVSAVILEQRDALADRDQRLAVVEATLIQQQATIAQLTALLGAKPSGDDDDPPRGLPTGMPGLKPTEPTIRDRGPRTRRATGAARRRMEATVRQVHALTACPDSGAPLAGGTVKRTREVIELPLSPVVVTAHAYLERRCPDCGRRCTPPPELAGHDPGQGRLGNGRVSLISVLREEARLPFALIQRLLRTLAGLDLSVGALVRAVQQVATRAAPVVATFQNAIRGSPVVHADETGRREAGHNGYVWTSSTPEAQVFIRGNRAKAMLTRGLRDAFSGVLVSDFYAAYTGYEGLHQYCWAHLLRDIHDLMERHPEDATVQEWADGAQAVFAHAETAMGPPAMRWQVRQTAEAQLWTLYQSWLEPRVLQTRLCQRILRHCAERFVFVTEPAVPATNNAAERSLRHLVVSREISGGTRSAQGTHTNMTLASLFGIWRTQGLNPFDACCNLLAAPQL